MNRIGTALLVAGVGMLGAFVPVASYGPGARAGTPARNGDVNGDGMLNIADPVYLLSFVFWEGSSVHPIECLEPPAVGLPATGQTQCYDAAGNVIDCSSPDFPGQDGFYRMGFPTEGRFRDNGDGTISDRGTGLMWEQVSERIYGLARALERCESLERAGHDDWRLPNIRELHSIVDYGLRPSGIGEPFTGVGKKLSSSTILVIDTHSPWTHANGELNANTIWGEIHEVRAVRGGLQPAGNGDVNGDGFIDVSDPVYLLSFLFRDGRPPEPFDCPRPSAQALPATGQSRCFEGEGVDCSNTRFPGQDACHHRGCPMEARFRDNGDGTLSDTCTGLMWRQDPFDINGNGSIGDEDRMVWQDALKRCEALEFAGYSDWRLPNIRELASIIDYGRSDPALDPFFHAVPDEGKGWYLSSTTNSSLPVTIWMVTGTRGLILAEGKDIRLHARAVRGGITPARQ